MTKAHLRKLTPAQVVKYATRKVEENAGQAKWDQALSAMVMLANQDLTVAPWNDGNVKRDAPPPKVKRSGLANIIAREQSRILHLTPIIKMKVPDGFPKLAEAANTKVEPFANAAFKAVQDGGEVFNRQPADIVVYGGAVDFLSPVPSRWATEEIKAAQQTLDDAEGEEETSEAKDELAKLKMRIPIRQRYVDPRNCWTDLDTEVLFPQAVEIREMSCDEIEDEFDVRADGCNDKCSTKHKVYHYANHAWCLSVLDQKEPKYLKEYEHYMGCNPYNFEISERPPANDLGIWRYGLLFHAEDLINEVDQILTDLATIHHEWTNSPIIQTQSRDRYIDAPEIPTPLKYGPNQVVTLWEGESIEKGPVPEIPQQSIFLLQTVIDLVQRTVMLRDNQLGEAKSGTSNNAYSAQIQVAQRQSQPIMEGRGRTVEYTWKRIAQSVIAINYGLPEDKHDAVYAFGGLGNAAPHVLPKDVKGWADLGQAKIGQAIEQDEFAKATLASFKNEKLGYSKAAVLEKDMDEENPQFILQEGRDALTRELLQDQKNQAVLALAGIMLATLTPEEQARLDALRQQGGSPGLEGALGKAAANTMRTGSPQMPQGTMEGALV